MREHELLDTLIFWVFCKRAYLNLKKNTYHENKLSKNFKNDQVLLHDIVYLLLEFCKVSPIISQSSRN